MELESLNLDANQVEQLEYLYEPGYWKVIESSTTTRSWKYYEIQTATVGAVAEKNSTCQIWVGRSDWEARTCLGAHSKRSRLLPF